MDDPQVPGYKLPKGGEEFDRLDLQHRVTTLTMGGLYPPEYNEVFEKLLKSSEEPRILDVGCGSGIWSFEMARRFPQAQVIGVDLTPLGAKLVPSNFSFRSHDLVDGLPPEYKAKFDIIHCRGVAQHVADPQGLVNSMAECLKPAGFLLILDGEGAGTFDSDQKLLEPFIYNPSISVAENMKNKEGHSWHSGWWRAICHAIQSPDYQPAPIMIKRSKGLEELKTYQLWLPINWEGEDLENGKQIGELLFQDWISFLTFSDVVARQSGAPPEMIEHWKDAAMQELVTHGKNLMNLRCTVATMRRGHKATVEIN